MARQWIMTLLMKLEFVKISQLEILGKCWQRSLLEKKTGKIIIVIQIHFNSINFSFVWKNFQLPQSIFPSNPNKLFLQLRIAWKTSTTKILISLTGNKTSKVKQIVGEVGHDVLHLPLSLWCERVYDKHVVKNKNDLEVWK